MILRHFKTWSTVTNTVGERKIKLYVCLHICGWSYLIQDTRIAVHVNLTSRQVTTDCVTTAGIQIYLLSAYIYNYANTGLRRQWPVHAAWRNVEGASAIIAAIHGTSPTDPEFQQLVVMATPRVVHMSILASFVLAQLERSSGKNFLCTRPVVHVLCIDRAEFGLAIAGWTWELLEM